MDARVVYTAAVRAWGTELAGRLGEGLLRGDPARTRRFLELDTVERGLERSSSSLRWSREGSRGLLTWNSRQGGFLEVPLDSAPGFVWEIGAGPLPEALGKAAGVRRLLPVREVEERERLLRRVDQRGKTVARLRLLRRRFRAPHRGTWSPPTELAVVEPVRGYDRQFVELTAVLDAISVLQRAADAALDLRPAPALPVAFDPPPAWPPVDPGEPAARALRRIVLRQLEVAEAQEAGLRADLDSEFLHDLRVAVRRTRALLAQLKTALAPGEVAQLRAELAWLGRATGPLRDSDVLGLKLRTLDPELAGPLRPLVALIEERRASARTLLLEALDSPRWPALRVTWRHWAGSTAALDGPALGTVLADRLERLVGRVLRQGHRLGHAAPAEELHALRIDCKKLRYLLECARDATVCDVHVRCVRTLKGLQEVLGEFNDARLQAAELERWAPVLAERAPLALLPLGRLVERRRADEREARERFASRFQALRSRSSRRDLARLASQLRGRQKAER